MAETSCVPIVSAALETFRVISTSSGLHDSTTITYDASAPLGMVWVHLVQGSAGVVPPDGPYAPNPWTSATLYATANTFVSNAGAYWYVITPGTTSGTGAGPSGKVQYQDGSVLWGYSATPPSLLHLPTPINHVSGYEDELTIARVKRGKFTNGLIVLISTAKFTKVSPIRAFALFDVMAG